MDQSGAVDISAVHVVDSQDAIVDPGKPKIETFLF